MAKALTRALAVLVVTALWSGIAAAQAAKGRWYGVAALGVATFETEFPQTGSTIQQTGATAYTVSDYDASRTWRLQLGYRLGERWAAELGYWNFGKTEYTATITAPVATSFQRSLRIRGFTTDLVYSFPVAERLSGLARAGVLFSRIEAGAADPGGGLSGVPSDTMQSQDGHLGVGLAYRLTANVDARLEYDYFRKVGEMDRIGTANIQVFSLGLAYSF